MITAFKLEGGRARCGDSPIQLGVVSNEFEEQLVASALIPDGSGRIFVQQRTLTRRLFPGCWDLVGGHVEDNEDVISALRREIREETGWTLGTIRHEISIKTWSDGPNEYEERQFIVDVDGDLQKPVLEAGKVSGWMWVDRTNVETLKDNRQPGDQLIYDSVLEALEVLESRGRRYT
jgi:8-oxo-dGTP pyrophosphatase MutT (NUDIX family)